MNGSLNRTFHRETVAASDVADEKVVRQHKGTGVYAGIQVEVRPLARVHGTLVQTFLQDSQSRLHGEFRTQSVRASWLDLN